MFQLINKLKMLQFKLGLITDNEEERVKIIAKKWRLSNYFSQLIISSEVHALKQQNRRMFEIALSSCNAKAPESVFIDNSKENLKIPNEMGFHTIFYNHQKNDISELKNALKKLNINI